VSSAMCFVRRELYVVGRHGPSHCFPDDSSAQGPPGGLQSSKEKVKVQVKVLTEGRSKPRCERRVIGLLKRHRKRLLEQRRIRHEVQVEVEAKIQAEIQARTRVPTQVTTQVRIRPDAHRETLRETRREMGRWVGFGTRARAKAGDSPSEQLRRTRCGTVPVFAVMSPPLGNPHHLRLVLSGLGDLGDYPAPHPQFCILVSAF